jgi:peptidyl-prolyl cis-trans isomerase C
MKQRNFLFPSILLGLSALASTNSLFAADKILATVNGTEITLTQLEVYTKQRKIDLGKLKPGQQQILVEALINRAVLIDIAKEKGLDKTPETIAELENLQLTGLAGITIREISATFKITDTDLKKYYDEEIVAKSPAEYKARHILLKKKKQAEELIKKLEGGTDFAELAKKHSTGPSGKKGGDLGWFPAGQMVPAFSKALATMEKGKYSKEPVQTKFGWHIILLEDKRSKKIAPYSDKIKPALKKRVLQHKMAEYLIKVREKANVTKK